MTKLPFFVHTAWLSFLHFSAKRSVFHTILIWFAHRLVEFPRKVVQAVPLLQTFWQYHSNCLFGNISAILRATFFTGISCFLQYACDQSFRQIFCLPCHAGGAMDI